MLTLQILCVCENPNYHCGFSEARIARIGQCPFSRTGVKELQPTWVRNDKYLSAYPVLYCTPGVSEVLATGICLGEINHLRADITRGCSLLKSRVHRRNKEQGVEMKQKD